MAADKPGEITARQMIDLAIAVIPLAVIIAIQYRDEIERFRMRIDNWLKSRATAYDEALAQVQKEISLMEHGQADAD